MAYVNGVATGSIDLWDELLDFLTTNTDLVTASAAWVIEWTHPSGAAAGVVMRGPGAGGTDAIYIGMIRTDTTDTDNKAITFYGMTGVNAAALTMAGHVNVSAGVRIWLDGGSMKYWFVANGRRFMLAVNMSTVYQVAYAGFFLPYALPTVYPYPLFIGACSSLSGTVTSWRSASPIHAAFPFAPYTNSLPFPSNAYMLGPDAIWKNAAGDSLASICMGPFRYDVVDSDGGNDFYLNFGSNGAQSSSGYLAVQERIMSGYGDTFALDPITLIQTDPGTQHHGVLDGFYVCSGIGNAAENMVQIASVDHLIIQNVNRTTSMDYMAMKLE